MSYEINSPEWKHEQIAAGKTEVLRCFGHRTHLHLCRWCGFSIGVGNSLGTLQSRCTEDDDHPSDSCFCCNLQAQVFALQGKEAGAEMSAHAAEYTAESYLDRAGREAALRRLVHETKRNTTGGTRVSGRLRIAA
jgi:hypothetical protein